MMNIEDRGLEKIKIIVKTMLKVLFFVLVIVLLGKVFKYLLVDDTDDYSRLTLHEMYEQENIDILFLGSSHCFMGIDPQVIDEKIGKTSFNAGTVSQLYDGSFALLKEVDRLYDLEDVYMDLYYAQGLTEDKLDRIVFDRTYNISDFMKISPNKLNYIFQASDREHWINAISPVRRNWKNIFDYEEVHRISEQKSTEAYRNYEYMTAPVSDYMGKGFVGFKREQTAEHNWYDRHFDAIPEEFVTKENQMELEKIICYCKDNDINLTFIVVPMSDLMLNDIGNYDYYVSNMENFANQNNVDYVDFNLCKRDIFSGDDLLFYDEGHLNVNGAKVFSELLARYILGEIKKEDILFDSYAEKVEKEEFKILGYFDLDDETKTERFFELSDNGKRVEEYRVQLINLTKDGEEIGSNIIQEYSENKTFNIPRDEYSKLIVEHREKGSDESDIVEYQLKPKK